jgi:hypothetical protein
VHAALDAFYTLIMHNGEEPGAKGWYRTARNFASPLHGRGYPGRGRLPGTGLGSTPEHSGAAAGFLFEKSIEFVHLTPQCSRQSASRVRRLRENGADVMSITVKPNPSRISFSAVLCDRSGTNFTPASPGRRGFQYRIFKPTPRPFGADTYRTCQRDPITGSFGNYL